MPNPGAESPSNRPRHARPKSGTETYARLGQAHSEGHQGVPLHPVVLFPLQEEPSPLLGHLRLPVRLRPRDVQDHRLQGQEQAPEARLRAMHPTRPPSQAGMLEMVSPRAEAPGRSMLRRVGTTWGQVGAQTVEYSSRLPRKSANSHSLKGHATTFKRRIYLTVASCLWTTGASVRPGCPLGLHPHPPSQDIGGHPTGSVGLAGDRSYDRSVTIAAFEGAREAPRATQQGPSHLPMAYHPSHLNRPLGGQYGRH